MTEVSMGEAVYIVEDVLDHSGTVVTPETSSKGTVVGFQGPVVAVVQWGSAGDYRYADVPFDKLRIYDRRNR